MVSAAQGIWLVRRAFSTLLIWSALAQPGWAQTVHRDKYKVADSEVRGIYLIVPMDASIDHGSPLLTRALRNTDVSGVYLRTSWERVEPRPGIFDWSYLDAQIQTAVAEHRKVSVGIDAGQRSPEWLYTEGVRRFHTVVEIPRQRDFCALVSLPVPWDRTFLAEQDRLIVAMGRHFADDPGVVMIKVTGIGYRTDEVLLPHQVPRKVRGEEVAERRWCTYPDDVQNWMNVGYTPRKVTSAFMHILRSYSQAFPHQKLVVMSSEKAFPPIGADGTFDVEASNLPEHSLLPLAQRLLGNRFIAQVNNLRADHVDPELMASKGHTQIAFQAAWPVTGDPKCRMSGGKTPCDPTATFARAISNAIDARAVFIELFKEDLAKPRFAGILDNAAAWFRGRPPFSAGASGSSDSRPD
jgi:hypothetical protein